MIPPVTFHVFLLGEFWGLVFPRIHTNQIASDTKALPFAVVSELSRILASDLGLFEVNPLEGVVISNPST